MKGQRAQKMTRAQRADILQRHCYEPQPSSVSGERRSVDRSRCRARVNHGDHRLVIFGQCYRAKKIEVDGYGFCTQHGHEIRVRLGDVEPKPRPPSKFEIRLKAAHERERLEARRLWALKRIRRLTTDATIKAICTAALDQQ